jgi:hypothetical protein
MNFSDILQTNTKNVVAGLSVRHLHADGGFRRKPACRHSVRAHLLLGLHLFVGEQPRETRRAVPHVQR